MLLIFKLFHHIIQDVYCILYLDYISGGPCIVYVGLQCYPQKIKWP